MFSHLTGWRVNVALIQENASKDLLDIVEKCEGTKVCLYSAQSRILCTSTIDYQRFC